MSDIHELNKRRAQAQMIVRALGMLNTPNDAEDQLKAAARYRLAYDTWQRADIEYNVAIGELSTEELMKLSGVDDISEMQKVRKG